MENERLEFFDEATRISVVLADVRNAAQTLANAHLNGPVSAQRLAEALAGVALLGAEMAQDGETVSWKGDFGTAPLGGFLVEATAAGTLRGYTQKKILDDFDGVKSPSDIELLGSKCRFETVRSIPGKILASGAVEVPAAKTGTLAAGLDALFAQSLQRKAKSALFASVDDSLHVIAARGAMAELLPDGDEEFFRANVALSPSMLAGVASARTILKKIGLPHAVLRKTAQIKFACRCSPQRAAAMLAAIPENERASLPDTLDITCHFCGTTYSVPVRGGE